MLKNWMKKMKRMKMMKNNNNMIQMIKKVLNWNLRGLISIMLISITDIWLFDKIVMLPLLVSFLLDLYNHAIHYMSDLFRISNWLIDNLNNLFSNSVRLEGFEKDLRESLKVLLSKNQSLTLIYLYDNLIKPALLVLIDIYVNMVYFINNIIYIINNINNYTYKPIMMVIDYITIFINNTDMAHILDMIYIIYKYISIILNILYEYYIFYKYYIWIVLNILSEYNILYMEHYMICLKWEIEFYLESLYKNWSVTDLINTLSDSQIDESILIIWGYLYDSIYWIINNYCYLMIENVKIIWGYLNNAIVSIINSICFFMIKTMCQLVPINIYWLPIYFFIFKYLLHLLAVFFLYKLIRLSMSAILGHRLFKY